MGMSFYHVARVAVIFAMKFAYKIEVVDANNCPRNRGFILASNHRSNLDPIFIGIGTKRQVRFMAKEELFKNKLLGFLIKHLGAFPVTRGTGDHGALSKADEIVMNGGVLGIFPEGTRSKDGNLKRAKSGAVVVAAETKGDIVPVGIKYCGKIGLRKRIVVKYGKPILNSEIKLDINNKSQIKDACRLLMERIAEQLQ